MVNFFCSSYSLSAWKLLQVQVIATAVQRWCLTTHKMLQKFFTYVRPVNGLNMNFIIFKIYLRPVTTNMLLAFSYITPWKDTVVTYHSEMVTSNSSIQITLPLFKWKSSPWFKKQTHTKLYFWCITVESWWLSDITKYILASLLHTDYGWPQISYKHTLNPAKTNAIHLPENTTKMWWNTVKLHIFM
jgi:hypothetical protein